MNERERRINELLQKLRDRKISEEELKQLEKEMEEGLKEAEAEGDMLKVVGIELLLVSIRYVEYLKSQEAEDREEGKEDAKRGVNLKRGGMRSRGKG
jgi:hypothetical protein